MAVMLDLPNKYYRKLGVLKRRIREEKQRGNYIINEARK